MKFLLIIFQIYFPKSSINRAKCAPKALLCQIWASPRRGFASYSRLRLPTRLRLGLGKAQHGVGKPTLREATPRGEA